MSFQRRSLLSLVLATSALCGSACSGESESTEPTPSAGSGGSATAGSSPSGGAGATAGLGGGSGTTATTSGGMAGSAQGGESSSSAGGMAGAGGFGGAGGGVAGQGGGSAGTSGGGTGGSGGMANLPIQPFPGTSITGYHLAWADEFDGAKLDAAKWVYRTDSKHWSTQLPANVSVGDGFLSLHLKKESAGGMEYTGAGIISKAAFRYGYYEARLQTPPGRGWHTSFWMMRHDGAGGTGSAATSMELDVIENDSINPRAYSVNVHRWNPTPHVTFGTKTIRVPDMAPSLTGDFHVFGCELSAKTVKYFLDGALVQTVDATQFPHSDVNIWLTSIASYLGNTKSVDDTLLPATARVDYVRFFTNTP